MSLHEAPVIAALLESNGHLPPFLARMREHAPESFKDLRYGELAVADRELRAEGLPVTPARLVERVKFPGACVVIAGLDEQHLPEALAEIEAQEAWEAYLGRKCKALFLESAAALAADPSQAEHVCAMVKRTLDDLEAEARSGSRLTIRTPGEILAMRFDDSDRILGDRLLASGQSLVIAGAGSIGKSRLLLQLAASVISEQPFVSLETRGPMLRWLVLQAENSNRRLQADLESLRQWVGAELWPIVEERLSIHTLETDCDGFLSLGDAAAQHRIADAIAEHKPDVVCFDSLYNFGIGDLNHDQDMAETLLTLSRVARAGNPQRAIVVLHHALTGRTGAARATGYDRASFGRNSKVLHSWTRGQINVAPGSPDSNDVLVLTCGKCSNGKEFPPFAIRLNPESMIYEVEPGFDLAAWQTDVTGQGDRGPMMTPDGVKALCRPMMSKADLAHAIREECGCARTKAYSYIKRAEQRGRIKWNPKAEHYNPK